MTKETKEKANEVVNKYAWNEYRKTQEHIIHVNCSEDCTCGQFPEAVIKNANQWEEFLYKGKSISEWEILELESGKKINHRDKRR